MRVIKAKFSVMDRKCITFVVLIIVSITIISKTYLGSVLDNSAIAQVVDDLPPEHMISMDVHDRKLARNAITILVPSVSAIAIKKLVK